MSSITLAEVQLSAAQLNHSLILSYRLRHRLGTFILHCEATGAAVNPILVRRHEHVLALGFWAKLAHTLHFSTVINLVVLECTKFFLPWLVLLLFGLGVHLLLALLCAAL